MILLRFKQPDIWYKLRRNHFCEARTSYEILEGVAE